MQAKKDWRWAAASEIGTSHLRSYTPRQDAFCVSRLPNSGFVAVVSDGAGSASHSRYGAVLVCRHFRTRLRHWFGDHVRFPSIDQFSEWLNELRDQIAMVAKAQGLTSRQFASTLVLVAVKGRSGFCAHVGDGGIVARSGGEWSVLSWPETGQFASTTYFVTDDREVHLRMLRFEAKFDAFALFSDGIEDLALVQSDLMAHRPFFDPMIRPVDIAKEGGRLSGLSLALQNYLAGEAVCNRTDDDKTLILLSRQ